MLEEKNGIRCFTPAPPEGLVLLAEIEPQACPWHHYGPLQIEHLKDRLLAADIPVPDDCLRVVSRELMYPRGTGPGGRVRLGDEMMPGLYRLYIEPQYLDRAQAVLNTKEEQYVLRERV